MDGPRKAVRVPAGWRAAYAMLGAVVAAWFAVRAALARDPDVRLKYAERLGRWKSFNMHGSDLPLLWIHAASVGEVALAAAIVRRLRSRVTGFRILLTCNTATGRAEAFRAGVDEVRYLPVDFGPVVRRAVDIAHPTLFAFVETEIWPTLLGEGWGEDSVICLFSMQEKAPLLEHLRRSLRPKEKEGGDNGRGAILGYCWPSVMAPLLSHYLPDAVEQLLTGIEAVLVELPDLPITWQVYGGEQVAAVLDGLGFVRQEPPEAADDEPSTELEET